MLAAILADGPPFALDPLAILLGLAGGAAVTAAIAVLISRMWSRRG